METVNLYINWLAWFQLTAAVIVGLAIYDALYALVMRIGDVLPDAIRDLRDWWYDYRADKPISQRAGGMFRRLLGEGGKHRRLTPEAPRFVPDPPEELPQAQWVLNEQTKALHLPSCRFAGACVPWHWADSVDEARRYADEQGLSAGCVSCRPLARPVEV